VFATRWPGSIAGVGGFDLGPGLRRGGREERFDRRGC